MDVNLAISLLLALVNNAAQISALIQKAQAEGRDISPEEWKTVTDADDLARAQLVSAIKAAGG